MLRLGWFSTGRGEGSRGLMRFVQDRIQRGMGLVQRCNQLLNEAELKITQLTGNFGETAPSDVLEWDEDSEV